MRFLKYIVILLIPLVIALFYLSPWEKKEEAASPVSSVQQETGEKEILYWTCGMHPSVRVPPEEYEGQNCPICNMPLVPIYKEEEGKAATGTDEELPVIKISAKEAALAEVKTEEVRFRPLIKEIITVGRMDYDERKVAYVTAWVGGRIDKLFVDFTGVKVKKGQALASIYSPELVSTQKEYLLALETLDKVKDSSILEVVENARSLIESTKQRLLLWGIPLEEIERLERERKPAIHMTIYSPISGTVVRKDALEGKYVKVGSPLYTVTDLSNLWMFADVYEYEMSFVQLGQKVEIAPLAYPGETFTGKITFIDPVLHAKTRSVKIRADFPNSEGRLKPEMFVNAGIKIPLGEELSISKSALLDTGLRKLVYMKHGPGKYMPREVEIGQEAGGYLIVKKGLMEGDVVVVRANFLIDSQTQLSGSAASMYGTALGTEGEE